MIGAMAPDLAFAFGAPRSLSHVPFGLLPVCLPIVLLGVLWAEGLVFPFFKSVLPGSVGIEWPRLFASSRMPQGPVGWALAGVAGLIGAGTHILWDGFTHPGWWPTTVLYPDAAVLVAGGFLHVAQVLWVASTAIGAAFLYLYLRRRFPGPFAPRGGDPRFLRALLALLAVTVSLGMARAVSVGGMPGSSSFAGAVTLMILISLTAVSLIHRLLVRRVVLDG
jgi:hypothetical protein